MVDSLYKCPFVLESPIMFNAFSAYDFNGAGIKVEVASFCAVMDTLVGQDGSSWMSK